MNSKKIIKWVGIPVGVLLVISTCGDPKEPITTVGPISTAAPTVAITEQAPTTITETAVPRVPLAAPLPAEEEDTDVYVPPVRTSTPAPVETEDESVYYSNCSDVRDAGAAPIRRGEAGYGSHLDRDGDGVACEPKK